MRLLPALLLAALPAVALTERDDGGTVRVAPGAALVVSLPVQTGTGYTWQVSEARGLEQRGAATVERPKAAKPGAPARQVFRFAVKGEGALKMVYRRPFERGVPPAKTYRMKVVVP